MRTADGPAPHHRGQRLQQQSTSQHEREQRGPDLTEAERLSSQPGHRGGQAVGDDHGLTHRGERGVGGRIGHGRRQVAGGGEPGQRQTGEDGEHGADRAAAMRGIDECEGDDRRDGQERSDAPGARARPERQPGEMPHIRGADLRREDVRVRAHERGDEREEQEHRRGGGLEDEDESSTPLGSRQRLDDDEHQHGEGGARQEGEQDRERHAQPGDEAPSPVDRSVGSERHLETLRDRREDGEHHEEPEPALRQAPTDRSRTPRRRPRRSPRGRDASSAEPTPGT